MSGAVVSPTHWSILPLSQRVSPGEVHQAMPWGMKELPPGGDPWPGHWLRSGSWQEEEEGWKIRGGRDFPKKKHQMHKDNEGKIIWPACTLRIYRFRNSVSIYTGHVLGSYEMIFEQCRRTLLPRTLIYEMWTHKQMESYYHFAMNGFNFQMDFLGIRRQDYEWLLNSSIWVWTYTLSFVGGNLGQLEASGS